ncbi:putative peptidase, M20/M25/M40 family protein [Plesiocystis pacifica SIR-1]|uniref:Putative peptidase, M20/M25/M40 family protein n=2 Tax=Plesiocystis pacifica TaxID=191768 RepID=A6GG07_9BACT|nr:putative peptidase, M20/M25/M40 family protein [Plesiocystis pacifica SIR-1]
MYSSSADLRAGLSRALSLLVLDPEHDEQTPWWMRLPVELRAHGRAGQLGLEQLIELHLQPELGASLDRVRARLDLTPVSAQALRAAARRARISGRAHADHQGRDVYGESNKALWDLAVAPLGEAVERRWGPTCADARCHDARDLPAPDPARAQAEALVRFQTGPSEDGHRDCAEHCAAQLREQGFAVELHRRAESPPVLVAAREPRGLAGRVVLYGHYDTIPANPGWSSDPDVLIERERRWFARGIADNKGPLAARLWALSTLERSPALTWIIQGEEETGSQWSREVLARLIPELEADLWLEETGYHDHVDGTLRLLARTIGPSPDSSLPPDPFSMQLLDGLRVLAASGGLATRAERRGLNKSVVDGGCPFNHALPPGARYLAIGVNDSHAQIHAHDESIPTWTLALHRDELALIFEAIDRLVSGD